MPSPCLTCDFKDENKSSERCTECRDRLEYAVGEGMLPKEVLVEGTVEERVVSAGKPITDKVLLVVKKGKKPGRKPKKKKPCIKCGRDDKPIKARDMCDTCYSNWKSHNPDKVRPYSRLAESLKDGEVKYYDIRLQANPDTEKNELLRKTAKIARKEMRTIQNQVFYWIKEGVERQEGNIND